MYFSLFKCFHIFIFLLGISSSLSSMRKSLIPEKLKEFSALRDFEQKNPEAPFYVEQQEKSDGKQEYRITKGPYYVLQNQDPNNIYYEKRAEQLTILVGTEVESANLKCFQQTIPVPEPCLEPHNRIMPLFTNKEPQDFVKHDANDVQMSSNNQSNHSPTNTQSNSQQRLNVGESSTWHDTSKKDLGAPQPEYLQLKNRMTSFDNGEHHSQNFYDSCKQKFDDILASPYLTEQHLKKGISILEACEKDRRLLKYSGPLYLMLKSKEGRQWILNEHQKIKTDPSYAKKTKKINGFVYKLYIKKLISNWFSKKKQCDYYSEYHEFIAHGAEHIEEEDRLREQQLQEQERQQKLQQEECEQQRIELEKLQENQKRRKEKRQQEQEVKKKEQQSEPIAHDEEQTKKEEKENELSQQQNPTQEKQQEDVTGNSHENNSYYHQQPSLIDTIIHEVPKFGYEVLSEFGREQALEYLSNLFHHESHFYLPYENRLSWMPPLQSTSFYSKFNSVPLKIVENPIIGMEGPQATTNTNEQFSSEATKKYIEKNNINNAILQKKYGQDPVINNTFNLVNSLNKIANLFCDYGELFTADIFADLGRFILSNGRELCKKIVECGSKLGDYTVKFGNAVDKGLSSATEEFVQDILRPDLYLIRNAIGIYQLTACMMSEIHEAIKLQESFEWGHEYQEKVEEEYHQRSQKRLSKIKKQLDTFCQLPWDSKVEVFTKHGARLVSDFLKVKAYALGVTAGKEVCKKIRSEAKSLYKAFKTERKIAQDHNFISPGMDGAKEVAVGTKAFVEGGKEKTLEGIKKIQEQQKNPIPESKSPAKIMQETVEVSKKTGTVWDSIKITDRMYPNTKIPRSFEISVSNKKFWVHPNATEHMWEYIDRGIQTTHNMPINSQTVLTSFQCAVEEVVKKGLIYDEIFNIGCWQLKIGAPRNLGFLPVIYHAKFVPKGLGHF